MQPTWVLLSLPLDGANALSDAVWGLAAGPHSVGSSATVVDVRPDSDLWTCSRVPFANLLNLGTQFPHVRQLHLKSIVLKRARYEPPHPPTPCFALLDTLVIDPWFAALSAGPASITKSLFDLFPHMPRLRNLSVYAPMAQPHVEPAELATQTHLPFSLETFVCTGTLTAPACAQIISHSRSTLSELRITVVGHADDDDDEAQLVAAIAHAAPRLRHLDLRLRGDERLLERVRPVFAALAHLRTLRLETPRSAALADVLALLAHAPPEVPLRTLTLLYARRAPAADGPPESIQPAMHWRQLADEMPQLRRLLSVVLLGFEIGNEDRRELAGHWRARRVRCQIID